LERRGVCAEAQRFVSAQVRPLGAASRSPPPFAPAPAAAGSAALGAGGGLHPLVQLALPRQRIVGDQKFGLLQLFDLVAQTRNEADATLGEADRSKAAVAAMTAQIAELGAEVSAFVRDVQAA
jgi:hypothetical protein